MGRFRDLVMVLAIMVMPSFVHASGLGELRISLVDGDVVMLTEDTGDWTPVSVNTPLRQGDQLWVPEGGRVELTLRDGTRVRLKEYSALEILNLENGSYQFYMNEGDAYVNFRGPKGSVLQYDTPVASVSAYERTNFRVEVARDAETALSVFRGVAYAESRDGRTRVSGGKTLVLRGDDSSAELIPLGRVDEWERWNRDRDYIVYEKRYSTQYLPDELDSYAYDFDENGKWVYASDYGYVWTPTVHVSAGWAPYRNGRWTWIGGDYVWVGYEPWGWAPYHYGRWSWVASIGWCWVPPSRGSVYWGPGYVGWFNSSDYVSWVPLAPGEVYYGYGNYGPNSVNISITHVDVRPRYRNAFLGDAVTVIHHDTFHRGKHVDVRLKENPFVSPGYRGTFGRPSRSPEKMVTRPVIRDTPFLKQMPRGVREMGYRDKKDVRPFVKEQNRSVFRPDAAPKKLPVRVYQDGRAGDTRGAPAVKQLDERGVKEERVPGRLFGPGAIEPAKSGQGKPVYTKPDRGPDKVPARGAGQQEKAPVKSQVPKVSEPAKAEQRRLDEKGMKEEKAPGRLFGPKASEPVKSEQVKPVQMKPDRGAVQSEKAPVRSQVPKVSEPVKAEQGKGVKKTSPEPVKAEEVKSDEVKSEKAQSGKGVSSPERRK